MFLVGHNFGMIPIEKNDIHMLQLILDNMVILLLNEIW